MAILKTFITLSVRQDLSQIPAAQPSDGLTSNFVNPPSLAIVYRVLIYIFMPTMSVLVVIRLGTRLQQMRKLAADDYKSEADYPLGRHLWDVPLSWITDRYLELTTVGLILHSLGSMFFKLTLLVLYLRLFSPIRWAYWLIWAGIASITVVYTALSIFILSNCVPRKSQTWHYTTYYGSCTMAQSQNSLVNGVFGLISDLYILAIPLWLVSHLSLPLNRKLGAMSVFLTGLLACGSSAGGLAARYTLDMADGTWSVVYVFGILELNIGLICACMPVVALPFKAIASSLATSWNSIKEPLTRIFIRSSNKGGDRFNMTNDPSSKEGGHQLPQMVKGDGAITGLRSFIRRAYRSSTITTNTQKIAPMIGTDAATFVTFNSSDSMDEYHSQLRIIHSVDTWGQDSYFGSASLPGSYTQTAPQAPAALHHPLRYQYGEYGEYTGHLV
ncbi:hypothetical protein N8I77_002523 [Diaporthe amygdali]|uniref:Rhodopsin domain-containing protein n=1 Tax=Phomopsis amygdali TaxID=1214568 RepID=A0AAD9WBE3_PHOAM|nr:hypothetical protein N8I77_002523 [Diaporthe amygdali]